jgi:DNA-binding MarR family transcriptional regulator
VDILELAILTVLSEEQELSLREIGRYLGVNSKKLAKRIVNLEKKGYIVRKAYIGNGDVIFGITEEGYEELYKNYLVLRDLIKEMEFSLCYKFDC